MANTTLARKRGKNKEIHKYTLEFMEEWLKQN
jgi:hypothetical protein